MDDLPFAPIPCFCCGKLLRSYSTNQPDNGLEFITHGHYGTAVFDPCDQTFIAINVCDECLKKNPKRVLYYQSSTTPPVEWDIQS